MSWRSLVLIQIIALLFVDVSCFYLIYISLYSHNGLFIFFMSFMTSSVVFSTFQYIDVMFFEGKMWRKLRRIIWNE